MTKENTIRVIQEILVYTGKNAKQFSDSIGKDRPQWLYDVMNPEKVTGLSSRMVDMICETYPEFSRSYLLTGEGALIKTDKVENIQQNINSSHITQNGNVEASANMDKLINVLAEQSQQVTKAQEQIDRLITLLERNSKN
jgi:hypothetical protein